MGMYDQTDIFKAYLKNTTEKDYFFDLISNDNSLSTYIANQKKLLINDIGSHEGTLFLRIMSALNKFTHDKQIEIDIVEPSQPALEEFKKKNADKYKINFFPTTYDVFTTDKSYDLTIASHCLYWSPSLKDVVEKMIRRSKFTYIILRGKRGIYEIQNTFKHCLGNKMEQLYNADDIKKALKETTNDKYSVTVHNFTSDLNISSCKKFGNTEGEKLISFFLQNQYAQISEEDRKNIHLWFEKKGDVIPHDVSIFKIIDNKK